MAKNRHKLRSLVVICCLCLCAGIFLFIRWANKPVSTTPPETSSVQGTSTTVSYKPLTTTYFTTEVPNTLVIKSQNNKPHGNTLLQLFMTAGSHSITNPISDQLAITVGTKPADGLSGLTDVQLRSRQKTLYKPIGIDDFPNSAQAFLKTENGYEMSVFWLHNNYYAAVVVSGTTDRSSQLAETLHTVTQTWQWQ